MPSWKIHLKWNRLFGIPDNISREINELIDFPESWFRKKYDINDETQIQVNIFDIDEIDPCLSFYYLSKIIGKFGHDMGRKRKWQRDFQLWCVYEHYGIQGVKATLLHHILDYIEKIRYFDVNEILKRIDNRFGDLVLYANYKYKERWYIEVSKATSEVLDFVRKNITQILMDLKEKSP